MLRLEGETLLKSINLSCPSINLWKNGGKDHEIPNALSRAPVSFPEINGHLQEEVGYYRDEVIRIVMIRMSQSEEEEKIIHPLVEDIRDDTLRNQNYFDLVNAI
ncbi:unnamed protein product [Lepeophtheirus salmonis]|uniref:(salmon louse) hypothetical protein n=1 Tax=Lepeophtheirus salmonis TaxID=72036 RepID=A0A7R8CBJ8_LEPSM|nr:unnamed protein product [Lepeophtheirus salmonis]CAF2753869.1 unnamed protein product [Lepeophtheirus salmonis]